MERPQSIQATLVVKAQLRSADPEVITRHAKPQHYEIASYGTVRTFAELLGQKEAAKLLQQTLDEESAANEKLNELAEGIVNPEALLESEEFATSGSPQR